jgi:hypothetical protein
VLFWSYSAYRNTMMPATGKRGPQRNTIMGSRSDRLVGILRRRLKTRAR